MSYLAFYSKKEDSFLGIKTVVDHTEFTIEDSVPMLLRNKAEAQYVFNDIKENYSKAFKDVFQDYTLVSVSVTVNSTIEEQPC